MRLFKLVVVFFTSLLLCYNPVHAQDSTQVKWEVSASKLSGNKYKLTVKGEIKNGWHLYTQANTAEDLEGIRTLYDENIQAEPIKLNSSLVTIKNDVLGEAEKRVVIDKLAFEQILSIKGEVPSSLKFELQYDIADKDNFFPQKEKLSVQLEGGTSGIQFQRILIPSININEPLTSCGKAESQSLSQTASNGLLGIFILGFLGGLVALLTPCVFPMIPLTVSFFTKKSQSKKTGIKNAFLYGFFIFIIYVLLSVPFHFLDKLNPAILNNISTNVYLNVIFFIVFVVFAFSFFGFYEISLPGAITSKADSKSGLGNITGIFFMALTLAIVSFSCTGPILGSLLAGSLTADGGAMQLTSGMAGFGFALALPFALFALFPGWLNRVPKSGGWLNTIKVVLGFIELGLAFKFLSNADLVVHWGLLKREIFIGIWIIVGIGLTLYLFGFIHFSHDNPKEKISKNRKLVGLLVGLFTLYLVPGLTNTSYANLTLISGFPPPLYYSIYKSGNDCVLDLNCTRDYEEGLAMAKAQHKPILLDFTGYACVNCRRMEENVWSKPIVYNLMKEKFIVVSLYVDDKKKLPSSAQFSYTAKDGSVKEIKTVGDKWSTFETENFRNNAQPLYAILNTDEQLLNYPVGYVPSVTEYYEWLRCGVDAF
ncbi:MAG: cytochrome c biogenesis protein CcdA, partial [Ferruginibacter sp.]